MSLEVLNKIADDAKRKEMLAERLRLERRVLKQYRDLPLDKFLSDVVTPSGWKSCPDYAKAAILKAIEEAKSDLINLAVIRMAAEEGALRREAKRLRGLVDAAIVKAGEDES